MDITENAIRDLMDAVLIQHHGLERVDEDASIDENVKATGVPERFVIAYLNGEKALKAIQARGKVGDP